MHNRALIILIVSTFLVGGFFSIPEKPNAQGLSAQVSQAVGLKLPRFFGGIDWFQVLKSVFGSRKATNSPNICKVSVDDVITTDDRYTVRWGCGGGESPCTVYANGKVFSQVNGSGSIKLTMNQPAIIYSIRNRNNLPCNFQIAHQFQSTQVGGSSQGSASGLATLTSVTYATALSFRDIVLAHAALYDGSTIATTTILTTDLAATTTLRQTVSDIVTVTSDGVLSAAEEATLAADSTALTALGHGLELIKVSVTETGEDLLWLRENDSTKDTGADALFRINGYKTITGGGKSQKLVLGAPHRYDDQYTLNIMLREFVESQNAQSLLIGTFTKEKINPTGTGADSSTADDSADLGSGSAICTGILGPGIMESNDLGIYYLYDVTSAVVDDNLYFIPWGSTCPATVILHDETGGDIFDVARDLAFVDSRKIMADDRGGDEFWCQALASDGTASGAPVRTDFAGDPFDLDSIAISPSGTMMYAVGDEDLNVNTTDNYLYRFTINSDCTVSASYDTLLSAVDEIDTLLFDAYGNVFFTQDVPASGRTDIKYISNAAGGGTTVATLIAGDSPSLIERIGSHILDDITVNSMTITDRTHQGLGKSHLVVTDDTGDEVYTIIPVRDSSGYVTGLERTYLTDFNATSNTIEGLVMGQDEVSTLHILQENSSDSGSIYSLSMYGPVVIDQGNTTDVSRILGYQTMSEELAEDLNMVHLSFHAYRSSDWSITQYCSTVDPVTVSDGINSPNKTADFVYLEGVFSASLAGWNSCASDTWEIFPGAQVPLGAQTNKQGEFIQATNTYIGVDTSDIFIQLETPFMLRNEMKTDGSDAALRMADAFDDL